MTAEHTGQENLSCLPRRNTIGSLDDWGKRYLRLCLHLNKHIPGYVDAYCGPPDLHEAVQAEDIRPAAALLEDVAQLQQELPRQGYEASRLTFLEKQLRAIETMARKAAGEEFSYREEVERYFDISPSWVDEEHLQAAHDELEKALPGKGPLHERLQTYRDRSIIPEEQVLPLVQTVLAELRRRTLDLVPLPAGEEVEVSLVREQPWTAYNWYLGRSRSRIEVNVDLPTRAAYLLELFAHEAYPGHHAEAAIKEHLLYAKRGYAEAAIALLHTPTSVVAEGIADTGVRVVFEDADRFHWKNEVLYPQAGLEAVEVEQALRVERASRELYHVSGNAALLLYERGWPAGEVKAYVEHHALRSSEEAEHILQFLQSPLFRAYTFCYDTGEALIEAAMTRADDRRAFFRRLLTEQWTPSGLAALSNEAEPSA